MARYGPRRHGHVQAARAIEEALVARGLGRQIRYVDVMEHVPGWFRRAYADGYAQMAARLPRLYGLAYRWSDRRVPGSDAMNRVRTAFDARMIRSLRDQLIQDAPDWIVHTHFLAPGPMGKWIRSSGLAARQAATK